MLLLLILCCICADLWTRANCKIPLGQSEPSRMFCIWLLVENASLVNFPSQKLGLDIWMLPESYYVEGNGHSVIYPILKNICMVSIISYWNSHVEGYHCDSYISPYMTAKILYALSVRVKLIFSIMSQA